MKRKNSKKMMIDVSNSFTKSNELSMAILSAGLTLNQAQLFAFAIFNTQINSSNQTRFLKVDFEKKFDIQQYRTDEAKEDATSLLALQYGTADLKNENFELYNVFQYIKYNRGVFEVKWSDDILPHIQLLKDNYVLNDLTMNAKFRSAYSWRLYDYLKANYGMSVIYFMKEELFRLFNIENVASYVKNTNNFKRKVLDVTVDELNQYTELKVSYTERKKGRSIIGFEIKWSSGELVYSASPDKMAYLANISQSTLDFAHDVAPELGWEQKEEAAHWVVELQANLDIYTDGPILTPAQADLKVNRVKEIGRQLEVWSGIKPEKDGKIPLFNWLEQ